LKLFITVNVTAVPPSTSHILAQVVISPQILSSKRNRWNLCQQVVVNKQLEIVSVHVKPSTLYHNLDFFLRYESDHTVMLPIVILLKGNEQAYNIMLQTTEGLEYLSLFFNI